MDIKPGHFYRDRDGDVWQAVSPNALMFAANRDRGPDVIPFDILPAETVERQDGPLTEVRPMGWEEV
ncbi:hypothetical protein [Streptomyces sp. SID5910]|uniref:hypothetical protein n=1 Tax=Streptomyces sp. SID5910 TaxID=2690312 RepID=UPI00136BECFE|nr:hypothetical protein [Streptomyces sp. SID5910]MYR43105.1 hypothetical protein [Streptomyces sp. SID5910]